MADPAYQYIDSTGVIVADTSSLLAEVEQEYKDAFQDQNLVVTADTPQGVLITAETLGRTQLVNNNAALANQINPNAAGGVFLDAIMALLGMQRTSQTPSVVSNVSLTGVAGTVIPQGSSAQTSLGDVFMTTSEVTLASDGTASVTFQSVEYGPIACGENDLTIIVSNILGWETVTNPTAAVLGTTTQSDQAARALRNNTLAFQGVSLPEAITSALYATAGVTSLIFRENVTSDPITIEGVTLTEHSVYVCVAGGTDADVAAALLENKSSGAAWNGSTVVSVTEPASGQAYSVHFDRPSEIGVLVRVTTTNGNAANITQAILDYAAGSINGLQGFVVGADVSPFELAAAIASEYPGTYINKVEISLVSPVSYSTDVLPININQQARTQSSYISVVAP